MSQLSVVTDQSYAPVFRDWLLEHLGSPFEFGETHYIGSVLHDEDKVEIVGVTALNGWTTGSCEAHAASDGSKRQKIDRRYIWTVYDYAFNHAGKNCLRTFVSADNHRSLALQELLGLTRVGLVPGYYGKDKDAYVFAITRQQWLDGKWGSLEAQKSGE